MKKCTKCLQERPPSAWEEGWFNPDTEGYECGDCNYMRCMDCRSHRTEYYILKEKIWETIAAPASQAYLCLECANRRSLGRRGHLLTREDIFLTPEEMEVVLHIRKE
jgi:hypothetical protein